MLGRSKKKIGLFEKVKDLCLKKRKKKKTLYNSSQFSSLQCTLKCLSVTSGNTQRQIKGRQNWKTKKKKKKINRQAT